MLKPFQLFIYGLVSLASMAYAQQPQAATGKRLIDILDPQSQATQNMQGLLWTAGIFSFLVLIVTGGALWWVVQKYKTRPGTRPTKPGDSNEPAQFHGNNVLEMFLIGVPVLIVSVLSIYTAKALADVTAKPSNVAETIQVNGWQFWWDFDYEKQGFRNSNELVIPAGQPVELKVSGKDVIHSFGVANLGGRRDAIPGQTNKLIINAAKPGIYYGQCFELCGASHANMLFRVIALPQAEYNDWVSKAKAFQAPTPSDPQLAQGLKVFQANCSGCHAVKGLQGGAPSFPDLSYFGSHTTYAAGIFRNVDNNSELSKEKGDRAVKINGQERVVTLEDWIRNSAQVKPGSLMPAFDGSMHEVKNAETGKWEEVPYTKLSDDDINAVAAYLRSLKLEGVNFKAIPEITNENRDQ
ncbi:cytochrome c oxidase subunit II [Deinococcus cellulosilyticus]|uniref:cytochrome-c oxidase n=1 Tax=Deinococcus cellulosilyticus (strain DSM 18568 / NBRC 106333 / KACC 11606 / 5516J-15) TaxID=1223518 RepID=A0A511N597_DEIC1|nr:cytochrome c oxidase subunit II [Deinococcus cellulosilyticus]GEM48020.1 cytochrome c oxidase subunit 2 [Deinococcus cellulosilyticus NBRC 106333 = KACC 11606]